MYSSRQIRKEHAVRPPVKPSLEKPGMYLIALRAHLLRGKAMIGDVLQSVGQALPAPTKREPDEA